MARSMSSNGRYFDMDLSNFDVEVFFNTQALLIKTGAGAYIDHQNWQYMKMACTRKPCGHVHV
jgi:hypothetical protein